MKRRGITYRGPAPLSLVLGTAIGLALRVTVDNLRLQATVATMRAELTDAMAAERIVNRATAGRYPEHPRQPRLRVVADSGR